jgi:hypothetical protein
MRLRLVRPDLGPLAEVDATPHQVSGAVVVSPAVISMS